MSSDTASLLPDQDYFAALRGEAFIVLTTFRQSGTAVPTTVWFAEAEGKLYLTTHQAAGKAKRIRANPRVLVAPSDRTGNVHGPAFPAQARQLEAHEDERAVAALRHKYGEQYAMLTERMDASSPGVRIFIELTPPV